MDSATHFVALYDKVLITEKRNFFVNDNQIRDAIRVMKEVYKPNPDWELDQAVNLADYNNAAHRCAYVHKYALCYTGMVYEILKGGGPGTEALGALAAIFEYCQFIPCHLRIIDYVTEWERTFSLILEEIQKGNYGGLSNMMSASYFRYEYLGSNLLFNDGFEHPKVRQAVMSADILMMVKFISAAACKHTQNMVRNVFHLMQPGAMLIFIDNAAGGFQEMMDEAAEQYGMDTVYGPLKHYDYEKPGFSITRFGYTSQSKTKVTIQIWQKPRGSHFNTSPQLRNEYFSYRPLNETQRNTRNAPAPVRIHRSRSRSRSKNRNRNRRNFAPDGSVDPDVSEEQENGCCSII